jgi:hypothetical protein
VSRTVCVCLTAATPRHLSSTSGAPCDTKLWPVVISPCYCVCLLVCTAAWLSIMCMHEHWFGSLLRCITMQQQRSNATRAAATTTPQTHILLLMHCCLQHHTAHSGR